MEREKGTDSAQDALEDAYAAWEAAEFAAASASLDESDYAGRLRLAADAYRRRFSPAYFAGSAVARWSAGLGPAPATAPAATAPAAPAPAPAPTTAPRARSQQVLDVHGEFIDGGAVVSLYISHGM